MEPGARGTTRNIPHTWPGVRRTLQAEDEGKAPGLAPPAPATTAPSGSCRPQQHPGAGSRPREAPSGSSAGLAALTPARLPRLYRPAPASSRGGGSSGASRASLPRQSPGGPSAAVPAGSPRRRSTSSAQSLSRSHPVVPSAGPAAAARPLAERGRAPARGEPQRAQELQHTALAWGSPMSQQRAQGPKGQPDPSLPQSSSRLVSTHVPGVNPDRPGDPRRRCPAASFSSLPGQRFDRGLSATAGTPRTAQTPSTGCSRQDLILPRRPAPPGGVRTPLLPSPRRRADTVARGLCQL